MCVSYVYVCVPGYVSYHHVSFGIKQYPGTRYESFHAARFVAILVWGVGCLLQL